MHPCFFCGSNEVKHLRSTHDMLFDIPGEFDLVECCACGLVYLDKRPSPEEIIAHYPSEYLPYRRAIQDEPSALLRFFRTRNIMKRVNLIERYQSTGTVLDIGCSTGIFLDAMRTSGWQAQGIEISPQAAGYARERFGLDVITGEIESACIPENAFDVVTMWDVLEHTFHPLEVLQKVNQVLVKNGIIALTIPNWESLDHRLFGQYWIGYDVPRHLFMFRMPVLTRMLEQSGFSVVRSYSGLGGYYTFLASYKLWSNETIRAKGLRDSLDALLRFPGMRFPFQPVFSLIDWLGLGGTRVVIARTNK